MIPVPGALGARDLVAWRIDHASFASTWDSGEGSFLYGGRWNSPGVRAVYCSLDASTAILEVAVHKTFRVLDTVPHVLTALRVNDVLSVHVVHPSNVPDPNWLRPGNPGASQQAFGDSLLASHKFILIPSAVSPHCSNLIFDAARAKGDYVLELQEPFTLDPRLRPPP